MRFVLKSPVDIDKLQGMRPGVNASHSCLFKSRKKAPGLFSYKERQPCILFIDKEHLNIITQEELYEIPINDILDIIKNLNRFNNIYETISI